MTHGGMLLAVDPGDEHVGVAWFDKQEKGWGCVLVLEMTPGEFQEYLGPALHSGIFRYFVVESFALQRAKALQQIGSEFETSQLIGVCKYVHWLATGEHEIHLEMQPPSIKKAIFAILARKGYKFTADRLKVPAQHVRDAEVHGIRFIKQVLDEKVVLSSELWTDPPG